MKTSFNKVVILEDVPDMEHFNVLNSVFLFLQTLFFIPQGSAIKPQSKSLEPLQVSKAQSWEDRASKEKIKHIVP